MCCLQYRHTHSVWSKTCEMCNLTSHLQVKLNLFFFLNNLSYWNLPVCLPNKMKCLISCYLFYGFSWQKWRWLLDLCDFFFHGLRQMRDEFNWWSDFFCIWKKYINTSIYKLKKIKAFTDNLLEQLEYFCLDILLICLTTHCRQWSRTLVYTNYCRSEDIYWATSVCSLWKVSGSFLVLGPSNFLNMSLKYFRSGL